MFKYNKNYYEIVKNYYDSQKANYEKNGNHPAFEAGTVWSIIKSSLKKRKIDNLDEYKDDMDYRRLIIQIVIDLREVEDGAYATGDDNMGSSLDSASTSLLDDVWFCKDQEVVDFFVANMTPPL